MGGMPGMGGMGGMDDYGGDDADGDEGMYCNKIPEDL